MDLEIGILVISCWIVTGVILQSYFNFSDYEDKILNICAAYGLPGHYCVLEAPSGSNATTGFYVLRG